MSLTIDLSSLESYPDPFLQQLERLKRLYQNIGLALDVEEQIVDENRKAAEARSRDSYEEWEHLIYDEQEEDLEECQMLRSQFVMVFLAAAVRELLDEMECEIKRAHNDSFRDSNRACELGRSKKDRSDLLGRFCRTFQDFKINLECGPEWESIKGIVNARDTIMHPERQKRPRYSDGQGIIRLTTQKDFDTLLDKLHQFCKWLRGEVRAAGEAR